MHMSDRNPKACRTDARPTCTAPPARGSPSVAPPAPASPCPAPQGACTCTPPPPAAAASRPTLDAAADGATCTTRARAGRPPRNRSAQQRIPLPISAALAALLPVCTENPVWACTNARVGQGLGALCRARLGRARARSFGGCRGRGSHGRDLHALRRGLRPCAGTLLGAGQVGRGAPGGLRGSECAAVGRRLRAEALWEAPLSIERLRLQQLRRQARHPARALYALERGWVPT